MFNWFKRKSKAESFLSYWDVGDLDGFEKIDNYDSIQFVDNDSDKIIYFSTLHVSGSDLVIPDMGSAQPTVTEVTDGWQFKSLKRSGNKILVCVISLKNYNDIEWAKNFFNSISPNSDIN